MVPAIRNILGGFLFSGDDVYKKAGVLSGGERTRLAVARMLLRPVEHAAARRADEPSRPRLEGHPARSARRLRRHADLRLARSVLRREARDQDRRDRPRRRASCSRAPTRNSCGARSTSEGAQRSRKRRRPEGEAPTGRRAKARGAEAREPGCEGRPRERKTQRPTTTQRKREQAPNSASASRRAKKAQIAESRISKRKSPSASRR